MYYFFFHFSLLTVKYNSCFNNRGINSRESIEQLDLNSIESIVTTIKNINGAETLSEMVSDCIIVVFYFIICNQHNDYFDMEGLSTVKGKESLLWRKLNGLNEQEKKILDGDICVSSLSDIIKEFKALEMKAKWLDAVCKYNK